jgi:putative oxidoreductase
MNYMKYTFLLGRALFASIFILKASHHFMGPAMNHAIAMDVPMPGFIVPLMGILSLLGGLSILFGYKAKEGAWLLIFFLVPTTLYMHPVWSDLEPYSAMMEQYCFLKNISLIGAALMITHFGSGPYSLRR